jgi:hypothetical protein
MSSSPYEPILETIADLDARLAGLDVSYSEENATAALEHVRELDAYFEGDPEELVALRSEVETLVETEDASHAHAASERAAALRRRIESQIEE